MEKESKFTGNVFMFIWVNLVHLASIVFTAGLAMPWGLTYKERWMAKHTIIDNKQLEFYGSGTKLFIKKLAFSIIAAFLFGIAAALFITGATGNSGVIPTWAMTLISSNMLIIFLIFTLFLNWRMKKWIIKHTRFA